MASISASQCLKFDNLIQLQERFGGDLPLWFKETIPELHISCGTYQNAFVSKGNIRGWPRNVESIVCDAQLNEIDNSIFKRSYRISIPPEDFKEQNLASKFLKGKYVYLGWIIAHYGHFITESISRFWWLAKEKQQNIKYIIHANYASVNDFPNHVKSFFKHLNVSLCDIVIATEPYIVEELVVPSQGIHLDLSIADEQALVWDEVRKNILLQPDIMPSLTAEKIFLSRKNLDVLDGSRRYNDDEVEDVFRQYGFEIIYPETLSFEMQVKLYSSCKILAGPAGSAIHNSVFLPENSQIIILGSNSFLFKTDALIAKVKHHQLFYFLTDVGTNQIKRIPFHIDCTQLKKFLDKLIK